MLIEAVNARTAARICGFESVAMLDYLQRSGVFIPADRKGKRRGKGRRYDFRELMVLKTISALLKNGASVAALKRSLLEFQKRRWQADSASLQDDSGEILKYFVVCGDSICFAKSADRLYDMTKSGQMVFSFVIDLDKLHTELCNALSQRELPLIASR
jgi:DNA-binding transcriptional MerR regulator